MKRQFGNDWAISSKRTNVKTKEIYDNIKNKYDTYP